MLAPLNPVHNIVGRSINDTRVVDAQDASPPPLTPLRSWAGAPLRLGARFSGSRKDPLRLVCRPIVEVPPD
jgi:hypothetical protein